MVRARRPGRRPPAFVSEHPRPAQRIEIQPRINLVWEVAFHLLRSFRADLDELRATADPEVTGRVQCGSHRHVRDRFPLVGTQGRRVRQLLLIGPGESRLAEAYEHATSRADDRAPGFLRTARA